MDDSHTDSFSVYPTKDPAESLYYNKQYITIDTSHHNIMSKNDSDQVFTWFPDNLC